MFGFLKLYILQVSWPVGQYQLISHLFDLEVNLLVN